MPVEIETLTSRVNVADTAAPNADLVEKILAMVLARIQEGLRAQELEKHEQEIRPHMSDSRF